MDQSEGKEEKTVSSSTNDGEATYLNNIVPMEVHVDLLALISLYLETHNLGDAAKMINDSMSTQSTDAEEMVTTYNNDVTNKNRMVLVGMDGTPSMRSFREERGRLLDASSNVLKNVVWKGLQAYAADFHKQSSSTPPPSLKLEEEILSKDGNMFVNDALGYVLSGSKLKNFPARLQKRLPRSSTVSLCTPTKSFHHMMRMRHLCPQRHTSLPSLAKYATFSIAKHVEAHVLEAYCVVFDKLGERFITGADDSLVKVWDAENGTLLATLRGHTDAISDMSVDPTNTILASASLDNTTKIWNLHTGRLLHSYDLKSEVATVHFSPSPVDGLNYLATTTVSGAVTLWTYLLFPVDNEEKEYAFLNKDEFRFPSRVKILHATFSPGGSLFVTATLKHFSIVKVNGLAASVERQEKQDNVRGQHEATYNTHKSKVEAVVFNSRGDALVSASDDGTMLYWTPGKRFDQWRFEQFELFDERLLKFQLESTPTETTTYTNNNSGPIQNDDDDDDDVGEQEDDKGGEVHNAPCFSTSSFTKQSIKLGNTLASRSPFQATRVTVPQIPQALHKPVLHPFFQLPPPPPQSLPEIIVPPPDIKVISEKLAKYIAKNGPEFRETVVERNGRDPKFGFLHEGHMYHAYFVDVLKEERKSLSTSLPPLGTPATSSPLKTLTSTSNGWQKKTNATPTLEESNSQEASSTSFLSSESSTSSLSPTTDTPKQRFSFKGIAFPTKSVDANDKQKRKSRFDIAPKETQ
eukprot:m.37923 g.37923  ORF g.37923 m.37923 type:complete len:749 (+) comp6768_c0_seq1:8-2254(+)